MDTQLQTAVIAGRVTAGEVTAGKEGRTETSSPTLTNSPHADGAIRPIHRHCCDTALCAFAAEIAGDVASLGGHEQYVLHAFY